MIHTWKDAKINLAIYYKRKNIFQNGVFQANTNRITLCILFNKLRNSDLQIISLNLQCVPTHVCVYKVSKQLRWTRNYARRARMLIILVARNEKEIEGTTHRYSLGRPTHCQIHTEPRLFRSLSLSRRSGQVRMNSNVDDFHRWLRNQSFFLFFPSSFPLCPSCVNAP